MLQDFIKNSLSRVDKSFKTSSLEEATRLGKKWYVSRFVNAVRRFLNFNLMRIRFLNSAAGKRPLRLHLGCGNIHLKGYLNIDMIKTVATDLVLDIRKLPYPDGSANVIETYHVIEHLPRNDLPKTLKEWRRILKPGGMLIIECPDFDEIVRNYLNGDEAQIDGIFALQRHPGDFHYFGYNYPRLKQVLAQCRFSNILRKEARDYHAKDWPCIRVECTKSDTSDGQPLSGEACRIPFTGERVIENATPKRIWNDHVARYRFATPRVKDKTVLDVSCGTGYGSAILHRNGAREVIGVDISSEVIRYAGERYAASGLNFRTGDMLNLDFDSESFDTVVSFETIEHIDNPEKALSEIHRVLKPGGKLILSSPDRTITSPFRSLDEAPANPFHVREYTLEEFIDLLGKYFKVLEVFGQRGTSNFFFHPRFGRFFRKFLPMLFNPARGKPELRRAVKDKTYRYVTAVCRKA